MPDTPKHVVIERASRFEIWEPCSECSIYHSKVADSNDKFDAQRIARLLDDESRK